MDGPRDTLALRTRTYTTNPRGRRRLKVLMNVLDDEDKSEDWSGQRP
ncbi:hypothetical protein A2U01_0116089 [Trifolium medium]|uniref:Uncharacterized protein n=1 Tax=Trifolium medium TaxID=97028 RepID=A0A392W6M0_9FABA|nr:hypothetical protein [Trifolium medium]